VVLLKPSDLLEIVLILLLRILNTLNEPLDSFRCAVSLQRFNTLALVYLELLIHVHFTSVEISEIFEQHFVLLDANVCGLCYLVNEFLSLLLT
jgi:hypothetical protein